MSLDGLDELSVSLTKNPVASDCTNSGVIDTNLDNLSCAQCNALVIHPYIYKRSDTQRDFLHNEMTPSTAIALVIDKLNDAHDVLVPELDEAICVFILGRHEKEFAENLNQFNAICPLEDLQMVERRANQLAVLESTKVDNKHKLISPYFQTRKNNSFVAIATGANSALELASLSSAYDVENTSPLDRLGALGEEKKAFMAQQETDFNALKASFSEGVGKAAYFESFTKTTLKNSDYPSDDHALTACVLFTGSASALLPLKELFSL